MPLKFEVLLMHLLVGTFFVGLVGCAITVAISWVSIFKSGFSDRDDAERTDASLRNRGRSMQ